LRFVLFVICFVPPHLFSGLKTIYNFSHFIQAKIIMSQLITPATPQLKWHDNRTLFECYCSRKRFTRTIPMSIIYETAQTTWRIFINYGIIKCISQTNNFLEPCKMLIDHKKSIIPHNCSIFQIQYNIKRNKWFHNL